MSKIIIRKINNFEEIYKFFDDIFKELKPRFKKRDELLLKPNFVLEDLKCITNPIIVKTLAKYLMNKGYKVSIGDGGYFKNTADNVYKKYFSNSFKFYNFSKGEFVYKSIENFKSIEKVPVNVKALKFRDNFISIPKLKVHTLAKVSLSFKNNMGFLKKPANFMHKNFDEKIVDLYKLFKPNLIIIDGITGGELSEMICKEVKHDILIASNDALAIDTTATYLMNIDINRVNYLRIAEKQDLGVVDLKSYDIDCNVDLKSLIRKYRIL